MKEKDVIEVLKKANQLKKLQKNYNRIEDRLILGFLFFAVVFLIAFASPLIFIFSYLNSFRGYWFYLSLLAFASIFFVAGVFFNDYHERLSERQDELEKKIREFEAELKKKNISLVDVKEAFE